MVKYDYLIVGAGFFGSVFAHEARKAGKRVLVVDRRKHIGGNAFTAPIVGINVHEYGAHIFHTNNKQVWDYVNRFAEFNNYVNSPIADYHGEIYNLPFNMNTFNKMWGVRKPEEAQAIIQEQIKASGITAPKNLEEQAICLVGTDIYEKLIKGYTEKQWGKPCKDLPAFIIKRIPLRFTYDNNYFNDRYQGIPIGGYTQIFEKLLEGIELLTELDFIRERATLSKACKKIIYTGAIDEYYDYTFGELEYRSLRFCTEVKRINNFQGNAVVNFTDKDTEYTRIIEHKHFESVGQKPNEQESANGNEKTVITCEYPSKWHKGREPYYPVNDDKNNELYKKYERVAAQDKKVTFGGRLGKYKYLNMDETISDALELSKTVFKSGG